MILAKRPRSDAACSQCWSMFTLPGQISTKLEMVREHQRKRRKKSPSRVFMSAFLFLSRARDGITHSCRQCQESGVENDAETGRPEHVRCVVCLPNKCRFFGFENVLVSKNCRSKGFSGRWSRIWNPFYHMRHQYQDQDAPRICQLLRIPIFFYFIILTQWSAIRKTLRKAIFLKPNNFEKIWRHTTCQFRAEYQERKNF